MGKQDILAIDLGCSLIKAFSGSVDSNGKVVPTGIGVVPTDGFTKGVITNQDSVIKSLKQAVDCVASDTDSINSEIYLGISGMGLEAYKAVGSIALNAGKAVSDRDVDRVCRAAVLASVTEELEVLHVLPECFRVDDEVFSAAPLGKSGQRLLAEVQIVTVPKTMLNSFVQAVETSGIHIARIVANAVVAGAALTAGLPVKPCIVLDIGAGNTDIIMYNAYGKIHKMGSLPLGGDYITSDIMQGVGINYDHAEAIKRYFSKLDKKLHGSGVILDCNDQGTTDKNIAYDFLYNIIESRVEEIVGIIHAYLKPALTEVAAENTYITGGSSLLSSFSECVERIFEMPAGQAAAPQGLSPEYFSPINTACYGVLDYAAASQAPAEGTGNSISLWTKVRQFFRPAR